MPERKEYALSEFKRLNLEVNMFPAFNGKEMGLCTNKPYLFDHPTEFWSPPYGTGTNPPFFCGSGIQALNASNFAIIKSCLAQGIDEVMIFEDDISFKDGFVEKFHELKKELPNDWLMVHLSYCCLHYMNPYSTNLKIGKCLCTPCMYYSKAGMELIEQNARFLEPWDIYLFNIMPPQFIVDPQMADQLSIIGKFKTTLS
jgi:hypothetical protein